jgi:hypothetical protein
MDKRTGEHTNKETREYEDKRTSAPLHPKRALCTGRVKGQEDKNDDGQQNVNSRTREQGDNIIRGLDDNITKEARG